MSDPIIVENETTLVIREHVTRTLVISAPGPQGIQGEPGPGIPAGGTVSQLLAKAGAADFDTEWVNPLTAGSDYETPLSFNSPLSRSGDDVSFLFNTSNSWTGDNAFSGTLAIPNGANPAVAAAGRMALDTTDNQLVIHNGSAAQVHSLPKKTLSFVLESPDASDIFPIAQLPYAITVTKIRATALGGTSVTFQLQKRASGSLGSSGTNMLSSALVATTSGAETASFSAAGAAADDHLVFVSSAVSGTVEKIIVKIEFTIDRT